MLMITRTDNLIEFGYGETTTIAIDLANITGSMLAAERLPCGQLHYALLLATATNRDPVRIEGEHDVLAAVHQYVIDTLLQPCDQPALPRYAVH